MPAPVLVISASLRPGSRSAVMAQTCLQELQAAGAAADLVELRNYPMPICDGETAYGDRNVQALKAQIEAAQALVVAVPIYNYDVNAAAKNLVELTGSAWEGKPVGFLCAAGGDSSYMSIMGFANSLMLDFRCWVVPRFVYATGKHFSGGELSDPDVTRRIRELAQAIVAVQVPAVAR